MSASVGKTVKRSKDEYFTPPILVEAILNHVNKFDMCFQEQHSRQPVILCPFDTKDSEFVQQISAFWTVKHGHIAEGKDFFTYDYGEWDVCISNPPFSLKKKIYQRLFDLNKPFALVGNMMQINYEEIGRLFSKYDVQMLSFDRRVSYDGRPSSFMSGYFCYNFLEHNLIFETLEHNNTGKNFVASKMNKVGLMHNLLRTKPPNLIRRIDGDVN